ncbi:MAG: hypothetical protein IT360_01085 [Gemmatimonadaceae bacterium]|nr:hypothetical protein [Gemmatimonadaceae bacterium]
MSAPESSTKRARRSSHAERAARTKTKAKRKASAPSSVAPRTTVRGTAQGVLRVLDSSTLSPPRFARLEDAPEELQRRVTFRYPWVQAAMGRPPKQSVERALREHAQLTGVATADIPKRSTVLTWVRRFEAFGRCGLLDGLRADAGTKRALKRLPAKAGLTPDEVEHLIAVVVCGAKGKTIDVVHLVNERLRRFGVEVPYQTVWDWVDAYRRRHPHDVHFAHEGQGAFAEDTRLHLGMASVPPGMLHSFDSSPADEWVRIPDPTEADGWRRVRPIITRVIDVGSRSALSFEVTIGSLTADIVLGVLRRAYVPGENWEGLPTVDLPKTTRADTGPEHRAVVEQVLNDFHLSTVGPPLDPESRTHIERLHRTLGELTSRGELGRTTTSRVAKPTDTSTREHARGKRARDREVRRAERPLMTLRTLEEFVDACLRAVIAYNRRAHSGLVRELKSASRTRRAA